MYILNIGLNNFPAEAGASLGRRILFAARALRAAGFNNLGGTTARSGTEDTLVVKVAATDRIPSRKDGRAVENAVYEVAEALNQDAIAWYLPIADRGKLVGPRAAQWGTFDRAQFIMPNGFRLSGVAA